LRALGLTVDTDPLTKTMTVEGCGGRLPAGPALLDVGQSGTTSRFVLSLLGLGPGPYRLDGHEQLRGRPIGALVQALRSLGVVIDTDSLPLVVSGGGLRAGSIHVSGSVSSQFLSGLLLAAPYARTVADSGQAGEGVVIEISDTLVSRPYVDLTIDTMADFGVEVVHHEHRRFVIGPQQYRARDLSIEPDATAASYFFAAAAITGGRVRIPGLGRRTRQGDLRFVELLAQMGANVVQADDWTEVTGGPDLRGIDVDLSDISDTAQTLAIVATFASSPTRVRGIGFIQHKETDRIGAVVDELLRLGIQAERSDDGFTIYPGQSRPGHVATYADHRMAMSFALLGLVHPGITLQNPGCVSKTFPDFFRVLDQLR
jgi:3-phosphoshikimate 1-carboxyvinyltransferase